MESKTKLCTKTHCLGLTLICKTAADPEGTAEAGAHTGIVLNCAMEVLGTMAKGPLDTPTGGAVP